MSFAFCARDSVASILRASHTAKPSSTTARAIIAAPNQALLVMATLPDPLMASFTAERMPREENVTPETVSTSADCWLMMLGMSFSARAT